MRRVRKPPPPPQATEVATEIENRQPDSNDDDDGKGGFFACYLLCSRSPRHKGHTYIGFTVNFRRRIRHHNGEIRSGAWRTKRGRPWEMILCIYGFSTNVAALQVGEVQGDIVENYDDFSREFTTDQFTTASPPVKSSRCPSPPLSSATSQYWPATSSDRLCTIPPMATSRRGRIPSECLREVSDSTSSQICGAGLCGWAGPISPLEASKTVRLLMHINGTYRAHWAASLGFCKDPGAPLAFRCITSSGGKVLRTLVGVTRMYPVLHKERFFDGGSIVRSDMMEKKALQLYNERSHFFDCLQTTKQLVGVRINEAKMRENSEVLG